MRVCLIAQIALDVNSLKGEMSTEFAKIDIKFSDMQGGMNTEFAKIDTKFSSMQGGMNTKFVETDAKISALDLKVAGIAEHLGKLDAKFDKLLEELARIQK
jgi:hypothetical protein